MWVSFLRSFLGNEAHYDTSLSRPGMGGLGVGGKKFTLKKLMCFDSVPHHRFTNHYIIQRPFSN